MSDRLEEQNERVLCAIFGVQMGLISHQPRKG